MTDMWWCWIRKEKKQCVYVFQAASIVFSINWCVLLFYVCFLVSLNCCLTVHTFVNLHWSTFQQINGATQRPYLWHLSVELRHIISQQRAKLPKSLLMPRIIFQRHFALYFCVVDHDWAELATGVRRVERGACLPVILKSPSAICPYDAVRVPQWISLYTRHATWWLSFVALVTTAVIQCANKNTPSMTPCWYIGEKIQGTPCRI
jgi:hypothetical protein